MYVGARLKLLGVLLVIVCVSIPGLLAAIVEEKDYQLLTLS